MFDDATYRLGAMYVVWLTRRLHPRRWKRVTWVSYSKCLDGPTTAFKVSLTYLYWQCHRTIETLISLLSKHQLSLDRCVDQIAFSSRLNWWMSWLMLFHIVNAQTKFQTSFFIGIRTCIRSQFTFQNLCQIVHLVFALISKFCHYYCMVFLWIWQTGDWSWQVKSRDNQHKLRLQRF